MCAGKIKEIWSKKYAEAILNFLDGSLSVTDGDLSLWASEIYSPRIRLETETIDWAKRSSLDHWSGMVSWGKGISSEISGPPAPWPFPRHTQHWLLPFYLLWASGGCAQVVLCKPGGNGSRESLPTGLFFIIIMMLFLEYLLSCHTGNTGVWYQSSFNKSSSSYTSFLTHS